MVKRLRENFQPTTQPEAKRKQVDLSSPANYNSSRFPPESLKHAIVNSGISQTQAYTYNSGLLKQDKIALNPFKNDGYGVISGAQSQRNQLDQFDEWEPQHEAAYQWCNGPPPITRVPNFRNYYRRGRDDTQGESASQKIPSFPMAKLLELYDEHLADRDAMKGLTN